MVANSHTSTGLLENPKKVWGPLIGMGARLTSYKRRSPYRVTVPMLLFYVKRYNSTHRDPPEKLDSSHQKQALWETPQHVPALSKLTFDLEVVSESRVTWATCVLILVFLGLSVLYLGPM